MIDFYVYFMSSLPVLHFDGNMPFAFDKFLESCRQFIPERDYKLISHLPQADNYDQGLPKTPVLRKWVLFDGLLRNELAKIRASRKHLEAARYLRMDYASDISVTHLASAVHRNPSIIEAEKMLDYARWNKLEELSQGQYFNFEALVVYAYKLLILERWDRIKGADKTALLENTLNKG